MDKDIQLKVIQSRIEQGEIQCFNLELNIEQLRAQLPISDGPRQQQIEQQIADEEQNLKLAQAALKATVDKRKEYDKGK